MRFLGLVLATLALLAGVIPLSIASAETVQSYPQRTIKLIVGMPPGGETDMLARLLAEHMGEDLGQRVIVEYKPGASHNIAGEAVAHSEPDGYTLLIGGRGNTIHKVMYPAIKYDYARDLTPLGLVGTTTPILVAGTHTSINSVQDLVRIAKEQRGDLTWGTVGPPMTGEVLKQLWGIDVRSIPYRGSAPALADLAGGHIDVEVTVPAAALAYIKAGKLRPLAVLGPARLPELAEVPTLRETGLPARDFRDWFCLLAPTGTPPQVIERLNQSLNTALRNPKMVETLAKSGMSPAGAPNSPAEVKKFIVAETAFWTGMLRKHGIGPASGGERGGGESGGGGDSAHQGVSVRR